MKHTIEWNYFEFPACKGNLCIYVLWLWVFIIVYVTLNLGCTVCIFCPGSDLILPDHNYDTFSMKYRGCAYDKDYRNPKLCSV